MLFYKRAILFLCLIILMTGCTKKLTNDLSNTENEPVNMTYTNIIKNNEIESIEDNNILVADDIICYNDIFYLDVIRHKYIDIQEPIAIYNYKLEVINSVEYKYAINSIGSKYVQFQVFPFEQVIEIRDIATNDITETIPLNIGVDKEITILSNIYFDQNDNYLVFMGNYNNQKLKNEDGQSVYGRIELSSKKVDCSYTRYTDISYNNNQCVLNYNNSSFNDQDQWNPIIFYDIKNNNVKEVSIQEVNSDISYIVVNEDCVLQRVTNLNDTDNHIYLYTKEEGKKLSIGSKYKDIVPKQVFMHKNILYIIYAESKTIGEDKILEVDLK